MEEDILRMKESNDLSCLVAQQVLDRCQTEDSDRTRDLEDHNLEKKETHVIIKICQLCKITNFSIKIFHYNYKI